VRKGEKHDQNIPNVTGNFDENPNSNWRQQREKMDTKLDDKRLRVSVERTVYVYGNGKEWVFYI
jgi:hypothetical protein